MNSRARAAAVLAAGAVALTALTACGGSQTGTTAAAKPAATTSTAPAGAPATTAPTTPAATDYLAPGGLRSSVLRAGLPVPGDFGSGLTYDDLPDNGDFPAEFPLGPAPSDLTCDDIGEGGSNHGARAWASVTMKSTAGHGRGFIVAARQYDVDGGAVLLRDLEQLARTTCASAPSTVDGKALVTKTTSKPRSGLGTEADLFEQTVSFEGGDDYLPLILDTLIVRYGDAVVTVGVSGSPDQVRGYDLAAKAEAYAARLGLR